MLVRLNKKHYLIALSAILVLSAVGFAYYKMVYIPAQVANTAKLASQAPQTAVVQQGDLTIYARGTGTLIAPDVIKLGFGASGPISELNVRINDQVHKGDVLATQGNREKLEAAVTADQLSVLTAKNSLQSLEANSAVVAAQAKVDLVNATVALNTAKSRWLMLQNRKRATPETTAAAKAALVAAKRKLNQAMAEYNAVSSLPKSNSKRMRAELNLAAAQKEYDAAARQLWYTGQPTEIEIAQVDSALALAEARLALAQSEVERVKNGPDPDQAALLKLQLANAEASLALSKRNLEASVIKAPIDGTILSVTAKVGDEVSAPFISMADLSQRYLEISLDSLNIDKIAVGCKVEVIFDALPNQIFTGSLIQIDPNLYTPTGEIIATQTPGQLAVVKALAILDKSGITSTNNLPLGLTATVDVIGKQVKGVILVPVGALHEQSPGKYAVFVIENGKQVLRPVEVGLKDSSYAEIKSGLKVGERVVTSIVSSK